MTCPEMIDVMATEGLWVSPDGKTPASTLYAAISRAIKDVGKEAAFRKMERGKFEAKRFKWFCGSQAIAFRSFGLRTVLHLATQPVLALFGFDCRPHHKALTRAHYYPQHHL